MFLKKLLIVLCCYLLSGCSGNPRNDVVNTIQKASKLSTTQFILSKYLFARKEAKVFHIKTGEAHFAAKTYAIVEAGIDMKKLDFDHIKIDGSRIQIELPPVEIISFSYSPINYEYLDQLNFKKGLVVFNLYDQEKILRDADLQIRKAINHIDIIPIVRMKTERVIRTLLINLGFDEVYLKFPDQNTEIMQV